MATRELAWDGLLNVRDLGGHPIEGGGETRYGSVVRADSVRRLSPDGWAELVTFGIRTILDLRFDEELEADPPLELPVTVVHVALLPGLDAPDWVEINALSLAAADPAAAQAVSYLEFLDRYGAQFASAIGVIADAAAGGVLIHCQAGKDRTGLVVALLLRLAGVPIADIAADYAISAVNVAAVLEQWIAEADDEEERVLRTRVSASPAETMIEVLTEVERRYGGVREYLVAAGLDEGAFRRARGRLIG
jgi:protein-tyrosine phosphatase